MENYKLDKLVEETINSMNDAKKAIPAPFLLTRINVRMSKELETANYWEKVIAFLTKPTFAFPALALVLLINFWMMRSTANDDIQKLNFENRTLINDGYSINTATSVFDVENMQHP